MLIAAHAGAQSTCAPFQLVGFTSAPFAGGTGVLGLTLACQAEFTGSRMCTSEEVMNTVTVPSPLVGSAWVRPTFVPFATGNTQIYAQDASGIRGNTSDFSCGGWNPAENDQNGMIVDSNGSFDSFQCDQPYPVACCAPVPIAVPEPAAMILQGSGVAGLLALAKFSGRAIP
jgi:hypothetical protein